MIGVDVERPFGEDEDANAAARSILSVVGQLSTESRKLHQTDFRNVNVMNAQRQLVLDLLERVGSAARRAVVSEEDMLEAARRLLSHRTRRHIKIYPVRTERVGLDEEQRRLDGIALKAREDLRKARELLVRTSTRVTNLQREVEAAEAAATANRLRQLGRAA